MSMTQQAAMTSTARGTLFHLQHILGVRLPFLQVLDLRFVHLVSLAGLEHDQVLFGYPTWTHAPCLPHVDPCPILSYVLGYNEWQQHDLFCMCTQHSLCTALLHQDMDIFMAVTGPHV